MLYIIVVMPSYGSTTENKGMRMSKSTCICCDDPKDAKYCMTKFKGSDVRKMTVTFEEGEWLFEIFNKDDILVARHVPDCYESVLADVANGYEALICSCDMKKLSLLDLCYLYTQEHKCIVDHSTGNVESEYTKFMDEVSAELDSREPPSDFDGWCSENGEMQVVAGASGVRMKWYTALALGLLPGYEVGSDE